MTAVSERRSLAPCGTVAAAKRHYKHGEKPCELCASAMREDSNRRYAAKNPAAPPRVCVHCGATYQGHTNRTSYCSPLCSSRAGEAARRADAQRRQELLEQKRRWHQENPQPWGDRARANYHRRRAKKKGVAAEVFTTGQIAERDGWRCGICGQSIKRTLNYPHPMSLSLDHVVPLAAGGAHSAVNTQAAHLRCNVRKGARGTDQLRLLG